MLAGCSAATIFQRLAAATSSPKCAGSISSSPFLLLFLYGTMTAAVCPPLAKIDRARAEALASAITDPLLRADVQQKLNPGSK